MVKIIKGKLVIGRGGALVLLVVFGLLNRMASKEQYQPLPPVINAHALDSAISLLKQGDLVLRRGKDVASYMISRTNESDMTYSHCGLVQIEYGYPFVYHFIGGAGHSPQGLRRDSAKVFFSINSNNAGGIMRYRLNDSELAEQTRLITEYYTRNKPFDTDFDIKDDNKLYCSEFVYKVMNGVKADTAFIKTTTVNGFAYVPVDKLYRDNTDFVWQMSYK